MDKVSRTLIALMLTAPLIVGATAAPSSWGRAQAAESSCAVVNLTTDSGPSSNLQRMIDNAAPGDRLRVRGVCQGHVTIKKDLTIVGKATRAWPQPTVDPNVTGCDAHCFVVKVAGGRDTELTVRDLKLTGGHRARGGGGIYIKEATVILRGSTWVTGNSALWFGGGIYLSEDFEDGTVVLRGQTLVSENGTRDGGGGIFGNDIVLRGHATVADNATKHTGGGIRGVVVMKDHSAVLSNTSRSSAGISGTVTMHDYARVCNNTVQYAAGGGVSGTVTMWDSSTICENTSSGLDERSNNGGGVVGTLVMHGHSSIIGNLAKDNGGGVWCTSDHSVILNDSASITGNTASVDGGGVFNECGAVTVNDDAFVALNTPNDISPLPVASLASDAAGDRRASRWGGFHVPGVARW
jgi:predicted outer membrane repeat protein